ncbi:MAG TPA: ATP-dependent DNA ligase [Arachidicoccus sp.]
MKLFTQLFDEIDGTTKTNAKVDALVHYFEQASEKDILYTVALLTGNRPRRPVKTRDLKLWAAEEADIPSWLFDNSYYVAGDLAETITLLLSREQSVREESLHEVIRTLQLIALLIDDEKKKAVTDYWHHFKGSELFVFNKLITGNFRMGVSKQLVIKALAKFLHSDEATVAHQLMWKWNPEEETLADLFKQDNTEKHYRPYPFYLAYPLEENINTFGEINDWLLEAKLDGIRGQIIFRNNELFVWSRGEDLLTDKFPEFEILKNILPDGTVLDGEIIPFKQNSFIGFNEMQTRIGRKKITKKILADVPIIMVCFDLLEWQGKDIREQPLVERRNLLENLLNDLPENNVLKLSQNLSFNNWNEAADYRTNARQFGTEGLMLKRKTSPYETGRRRGNWWKWKTNPMTIDGVLLYAQSGHGRRANLFTDYTFAVWDNEKKLLPFAKAYSGLTDKEILELDNWIKRNTIEKFGPVRSVTPHHVFEIAFEGIAESPRHKSGIALRFPRILRWRKDKHADDANTIEDLKEMLK